MLASAARATTQRGRGRPPAVQLMPRGEGSLALTPYTGALCRPPVRLTAPSERLPRKAPPVTGFVSGREKGSKVVSKVVPKVRSVTRLGPPPRHFINYKSFPQTKDESCTHPELKRLQGS